MIGGLPASAINRLGRRDETGGAAPVTPGLAGQPTPIQTATPQQGGAMPANAMMLIAQLLRAKQQGGQQPQTPAAPLNWRDQPMYIGGNPNQTYSSMGGGGDWRNQPAYLPQAKQKGGGWFPGKLLFGLGAG